MDAGTEALLLQLVQETRDDMRRVLIELGGLRERVAVLEQRPPPPASGASSVAGGLGGGALIAMLIEVLQRSGVLR